MSVDVVGLWLSLGIDPPCQPGTADGTLLLLAVGVRPGNRLSTSCATAGVKRLPRIAIGSRSSSMHAALPTAEAAAGDLDLRRGWRAVRATIMVLLT
jgi:hypothetical protein